MIEERLALSELLEKAGEGLKASVTEGCSATAVVRRGQASILTTWILRGICVFPKGCIETNLDLSGQSRVESRAG